MVRKLTGSLILATISLTVWAQTTVKISGKVVDNDSNEPLEYASISVKGKAIGTITNSDGKFDFYLPSILSSDTVSISLLGYEPRLINAKVLAASQSGLIKLKPKVLLLQEVVIKDKLPTPAEIIATAFRNVETNYPTDPYAYSGFVRELWEENKKTVSLVEGIFDIYDDGYKPAKRRSMAISEKVDLKFARASENYMNEAFKPAIGKYNVLISVLQWNQIKYKVPRDARDLDVGEPVLEDVVFSNNRTLYVVSLVSHSASNELFERKESYYIDDETFAIKKVSSKEYSRKGFYRSPQWPLDSIHSYQAKDVESVYEFEEHNGKMYLKYFSEIGHYDIHNSSTKSVEYEITGATTLVVTSLKAYDKLAQINTIDPRKNLALQTTPYDESFWTNYDQVKLVPLTDKQLRDLEANESLTMQFIKTGLATPNGRVKKQLRKR